jgi:hypothetical protein
MRQYGLTFPQAITELTGFTEKCGKEKKRDTGNTFGGVDRADNERRAIAYLTKTRLISPKVVMPLIKQGLIYQDERNNAVFPVFNEQGETVGAELQGTLSDIRFKGIADGSDCRYGFTVPYFENTANYALFFESAVDLLSFVDLSYMHGKTLTGCVLVSLAGLKQEIIYTTLKTHGEGCICVLCVDRDIAGQNFTASLKTQIKGLIERIPPEPFKDWNKQLQAMKG